VKVERWKVALATELVLRSGACTVLQECLPKRGPRRAISLEGFLIALHLADRGQMFSIADVAACYWDLPPEVHARFGVPAAAPKAQPRKPGLGPRTEERTPKDKLRDDFEQLWRSICHVFDSSPVTRPYLTPEQAEVVYQQRVRFCDALASGWLPTLPHDAHVHDGTALDAYRNRRHAGDPHARKGHRTPTDRDPRDYTFGFQYVCVVPGSIDPKSPHSPAVEPPLIVLQHELAPANEPEGSIALRLYRRHARSCPLGQVVGDRLVSYAPVTFALEIAGLGGQPVHDLHENLIGSHGHMFGYLVVDCWWWHPDLPALYWRMSNHHSNRAMGAYRSHFAVQLLQAATLQRPTEVLVGCPGRAYGPQHPRTLVCPRAQNDEPLIPGSPSVERCAASILCTSAEPARFPLVDEEGRPNQVGRGYQVYPRLSPAWFATNGPARAHVENVFSSLTSPWGEDVADLPHRLSHLPAAAVHAADCTAHQNHHRVWTWLHEPDVRMGLEPDLLKGLLADPLFASRARLSRHYRSLFPG
jgi:hypothetical protein